MLWKDVDGMDYDEDSHWLRIKFESVKENTSVQEELAAQDKIN